MMRSGTKPGDRYEALSASTFSQLRIKFFSKRQENFRAKAPSRKEKQGFFEVSINIPKLLILFARSAALRETDFPVYPG
jgi:hypothetical protein